MSSNLPNIEDDYDIKKAKLILHSLNSLNIFHWLKS